MSRDPQGEIVAVATREAPAAIGPYSQAVAFGDLVFSSGQIGLDPASGQMVEGIDNQIHRVFGNLKAVAEAAMVGALAAAYAHAQFGNAPAKLNTVKLADDLFLDDGAARNGRIKAHGHFSGGPKVWPVTATIMYWHFVDVVWVFFYPTLYLLK